MARILVIDDEATIRMLVRLTLEREGHEVLEAVEGTQGLAFAQKYKPDLVLLDMALPELNGLEVAQRLEASTPVLMLTGLCPEVALSPALAGIRAFVEKPFSPADLARRVRAILESEAQLGAPALPAA